MKYNSLSSFNVCWRKAHSPLIVSVFVWYYVVRCFLSPTLLDAFPRMLPVAPTPSSSSWIPLFHRREWNDRIHASSSLSLILPRTRLCENRLQQWILNTEDENGSERRRANEARKKSVVFCAISRSFIHRISTAGNSSTTLYVIQTMMRIILGHFKIDFFPNANLISHTQLFDGTHA